MPRDLSVSFERLGDLANSAGDPDAARRCDEDSLNIRKRLADAAPENADFAPRPLNQLQQARRPGHFRRRSRRPLGAGTEDSLNIRKRLADAAPENADFAQADLSISFNKLGDLARSSRRSRRPLGGIYEDYLKIAKHSPMPPQKTPTSPRDSPSASIDSATWPFPPAIPTTLGAGTKIP